MKMFKYKFLIFYIYYLFIKICYKIFTGLYTLFFILKIKNTYQYF